MLLEKRHTRTSGLSAVIFDVDGTLVDSNDSHAHAWVEAFRLCGYQVGFDDVRPYIGMGGDHLVPAVIGVSKSDPIIQSLGKCRSQIFCSRFLPAIHAFPVARELVLEAWLSGLAIAIGTSSDEAELQTLLEIANISDLIDVKVCKNDVESSKPAGDIIGTVLSRLGCSPEGAVMVGDSPYDIEAASRLGVRVIALRCGGFSDERLSGAIEIYESPADLLEHFSDSYLGRGLLSTAPREKVYAKG